MPADYFQILAQQLSAKLEATPGTGETLTSADVKIRPFQDISFQADFNRFGNDEVADDIGQAPDFVSGKKGKITFGALLKSSGTVGTAPAIGLFLRACGLKEQIVRTCTIGGPSGGDGAFKAGDAFTATGGKAGLIEADISAGGTLRYILTSGSALANTDVVTSSGDTATVSGASALLAVKYSPRSSAFETATIQRGIKNSNGTASQDYLTRIRAALGTAVLEFVAHDAARIRCDFDGVLDNAGAGPLFTGVAYESYSNATLPKLINATIQINGVTVRPSKIELDLGNTVELDPDPSTAGSLTGYDLARIVRREPKIVIDPYRLKPGVLDDLGLLGDGSEIPFSLILGTSPNQVEIAVTKAQIRQDTLGNRAGQETAALTLNIVRNTIPDNDFAIYFK